MGKLVDKLRSEIEDLKDANSDLESKIESMEDRIEELIYEFDEQESEAFHPETMDGQTKYDFFLEHFDDIKLGDLEDLIK